MADRVPYTGVPTQNFKFEPTPEFHIETPPAAFGVNVAQAVGELGSVQEGAGKEMFARALAFQDLTNHAMARGAAVQTAHEQAALWGEFDSKNGMDAGPEALNKLHNDLETVRQKNGANLNPMAQELYQNDAASTQSRLYVYSATHSARAVQQYDLENIKADRDTAHTIVQGAAQLDHTLIDKTWKKDESTAVDEGHHLGVPPDSKVTKDKVLQYNSDTSLHAVQGYIDRKDPEGAQKTLDYAKAKGRISGDAVDIAQKKIIELQDRVGVAETVNKTFDKTKSVEKNIDDASKEWDRSHGGDPVGKDRVVSQVMTHHAVVTAIDKEALDKANSAIDDVIHSSIGKGIITFNDLHDNPKLKDAFSVIESDDERKGQTLLDINKRLRDAANGDTTLTAERQANMHQLLGLSSTNKEAFLKVDLWHSGMDLTSNQRKELAKLQDGMRGGTSDEFRDRATEATFADYRKQIESSDGLGYPRGSTEYNQLRGQFQEAINYAREQGKVVDRDMTNKIMTKMLQDKALTPGFHGWFAKQGHEYQPNEAQVKMIRELHGQNITDDEVMKWHARAIYDMLYNKDTSNAKF